MPSKLPFVEHTLGASAHEYLARTLAGWSPFADLVAERVLGAISSGEGRLLTLVRPGVELPESVDFEGSLSRGQTGGKRGAALWLSRRLASGDALVVFAEELVRTAEDLDRGERAWFDWVRLADTPVWLVKAGDIVGEGDAHDFLTAVDFASFRATILVTAAALEPWPSAGAQLPAETWRSVMAGAAFVIVEAFDGEGIVVWEPQA